MDQTCNVLSLATGAGGLDLGVRLALGNARTVCAVEIEAYACEILAERMEEGRLDDAPIWSDLRSFDGRPWRGVVDLVVGGYPCQPFSLAGKRKGADDPRHLWPHVARVVREVRPGAVFFENVLGHVSLGLDLVVRELCEMGFRVEAGVFSAAEVGAPHRRRRVFILGLADSALEPQREPQHAKGSIARGDARQGACRGGVRVGEAVGDPNRPGLEGWGLRGRICSDERAVGSAGGSVWPPGPDDREGWAAFLERWPGAEPAVRRNADGLAARVDRLRLCGNGVVPQQAALAFRTLWAKLNG